MHPTPTFWSIERALAEAFARIDATAHTAPRSPMSHEGLADSIAAANAHRLRTEDR
jgi:hypothetical protein